MLVTLISEAYHKQVTIIYSILYSVKCKLTYLCSVYVNETLPGETGREKHISAQGIQEVLWIGEKGVVLFQYKMIS